MTDAATRLAARLRRRGLGAPGRLLADAHLPLAPLLSDLGAAVSPLLGIIGPPVRDVGELLGAPDGLDRLIEQIDRANEEADDGAG